MVHEIKCNCGVCKHRLTDLFYEIIDRSFAEEDAKRLALEISEEFPRHAIASFTRDDDNV
jgi:hypothetical protein